MARLKSGAADLIGVVTAGGAVVRYLRVMISFSVPILAVDGGEEDLLGCCRHR